MELLILAFMFLFFFIYGWAHFMTERVGRLYNEYVAKRWETQTIIYLTGLLVALYGVQVLAQITAHISGRL
jgi:uncharacterized membrane protein